jgi:hypothetical protein
MLEDMDWYKISRFDPLKVGFRKNQVGEINEILYLVIAQPMSISSTPRTPFNRCPDIEGQFLPGLPFGADFHQ